jgi:hypothetical protein
VPQELLVVRPAGVAERELMVSPSSDATVPSRSSLYRERRSGIMRPHSMTVAGGLLTDAEFL